MPAALGLYNEFIQWEDEGEHPVSPRGHRCIKCSLGTLPENNSSRKEIALYSAAFQWKGAGGACSTSLWNYLGRSYKEMNG